MTQPLLGAVLAALVVAATGCSGSGQAATPAAPASRAATASPSLSDGATPTPSLPPGDPGPGAPSVPDPGTAGAEPTRPGLRTVPARALVGPTEAQQLLGGRWAVAAVDPVACLRTPGALAERTVGLTSGGSTVLEAVSTHRSPAVADATVADLERVLPDCGWDLGPDPRLGTASLSATRGAATLSVVSVDGVTVELLGSGSRVSGFGWSGLVDIALGTSCVAAAEGCH